MAHIHLDVVGGISGDMFCSAMLDAFPELEKPLHEFISGLVLSKPYSFKLQAKKQKDIMGKQFVVVDNNIPISDSTHLVFTPTKPETNHLVALSHHEHYSWADIQQKLQQIKSHSAIYQCAKEIYSILATAESEIHGITLENIGLHEVGADDAIIDIISAAFLIAHSEVSTWSCSTLPWGQGSITCAHGQIPVPAPATLKILTGFEWHHDNEIGERITPTGAAILAWLLKNYAAQLSGTFVKNGYGCGNRQFKQKANILRVNLFTNASQQQSFEHDKVYIIQADIDDMTAENLAISQQKLRDHTGVIDLTSLNLMGKKGRWLTRIEVLCKEAQLNSVCQAILLETSTLGVRYWPVERTKLSRQQLTINTEQGDWPIKLATRPDASVTAKLEADALQTMSQSYGERQQKKHELEQLAIKQYLALSTRNNYE